MPGGVFTPALAAAASNLKIAPGPLSDALAQLSRQAGVDIGGIDPALGQVATAGVGGRMAAEAALARLLRNTPFTFEPVGPRTFRIVRRSPAPQRAAARAMPAVGPGEIVITGGKRDVPLSTYPGSAFVLVPDEGALGPHGGGGQAWLLARTATLQSTELGSGRNKLFIRGVADSSFIGPTQATVGTYFGDVRIGYNGPDPNLNLYDVDRVEVLEGPQGALYGAGSIGGIIRLSPHSPNLDRAEASIDLGASATAHGGLGYDSAGMINWAPLRDRAAVRVVAYRSVEGGYIDDPGRDLRNVNRQATSGVRISARVRPLDGWTIDGGYLTQTSHQPDLQYATIGSGSLAHVAAIGQPFEDDYQLARLVVNKTWDSGLALVGTIGRVAHDTEQRYDATRPGQSAAMAYDEQNHIRFTSYEARVSRSLPGGSGWIVGLSTLNDSTGTSRTFGSLLATRDLVGVTNRTVESAGYGELTLALFDGFTLTGGARYTRARMDGEPSVNPINHDFIRGQTSRRVDPEGGFNWKIAPHVVAFGQYQQGFRTGGLAVARGIGRVASYEADDIQVGEVGLRLLRDGPTGVSAAMAVSVTRWDDIQADLVSRLGFPYTANVGNGRIVGVEGSLDWVLPAGLRATATLFVNHSVLNDPAPDYLTSGARPLPATPALTATGRLVWTRALGDAVLRIDGNARYISHSRLGVGPVLDLRYGNYVVAGLTAALARGPYEVSLGATNLLDCRANRFAIGNPFGIAYRDETTPLRPRTIRLGVSGRF